MTAVLRGNLLQRNIFTINNIVVDTHIYHKFIPL